MDEIKAILEEKANTSTPEQTLIYEIIIQAVNDYLNKAGMISIEAHNYLLSKSFEFHCDLVNMDAEWLRGKVLK